MARSHEDIIANVVTRKLIEALALAENLLGPDAGAYEVECAMAQFAVEFLDPVILEEDRTVILCLK